MSEVILENLSKVYSGKDGSGVRAVDGVSLAIRDREFMVFVGPSGCGKSTTLRMIAGLEEISGGTVSIDGKVVNGIPPKDRDIAMVFQNYALYPHMTVYENMAFGLKLRKLPKAAIDARVREAAAMLGLESCLDRRPKALSGGQRQRVAVGRAIVRHPKVFLFDEPLSNLDAQMRGAMRLEISRLHARLGATMIYVTHDQVEAMTMGDRICVMKDGLVMQVDEPLTVYDRPANLFVAGFIGSPPMNFFPGTLRREGGVPKFECSMGLLLRPGFGGQVLPGLSPSHGQNAHAPLTINPTPAVLGLRPEDIHLHDAQAPAPVSGPTIRGILEIAEPMGAETHLHLRVGTEAFIARVRSTRRFEAGVEIPLIFDLAKAHLFDPATGQRLEDGR